MAEIAQLKSLLDAYGVGVRAGAITPQVSDEEYFRRIMDIPVMSDDNKNYWSDVGNLKHPITLKGGLEEAIDDAEGDSASDEPKEE